MAKTMQAREATPADIPSLCTLFPRAYYPVNRAFYSAVFPDTPAVRQHFWAKVLGEATASPDEWLLVLTSPSSPSSSAATAATEKEKAARDSLEDRHAAGSQSSSACAHPDLDLNSVIGMLCLRRIRADAQARGEIGWHWWNSMLEGEQDVSLFRHAFDAMEAWQRRLFLPSSSSGEHAQQREYLLVQIFGVDAAYKGTGLGRELLRRACVIADEKQLEIFVQANQTAKGFYERFGFVDQGSEPVRMASGEDFWEHHLIRKPGVANG